MDQKLNYKACYHKTPRRKGRKETPDIGLGKDFFG